METSSLWLDEKKGHFSKLTKAGRYDVVVIGGGITGVTTAYLLKTLGKKVCLLERNEIGQGDTGYTSAHLTYVTDKRLPELVTSFGTEGARLAWNGGVTALSAIELIAKSAKIDCEFRHIPGFLHAALEGDRDEADELEEEADLARQLRFDARFLPEVPFFKRPGIAFANQARFHPLKYLQGLAQLIPGQGCDVFQHSEVASIEDDPLTVVANDHRVECDYVVVATHVPLIGKAKTMDAAWLQSKLYPYSTYVVGARVEKGTVPDASFWDTSDPYHYVRIENAADHDEVIFGGADHKTGQATDTEENFRRVEDLVRRLIPSAEPDRRWSGQVIETNDGLPYIGEIAERQFVATGFAGNGLTFGTLAAIMACDRISGTENPWQNLFDVHRKKIVGGTWNYIFENLDYPYYYAKDRIGTADHTPPADLKPGEARVVMVEGERVACSCDEHGKLHTVSAICTHMGCVVRWNTAEKTWDCPCHGSRFHADGEVMAGPAESPLKPWEGKPEKVVVKPSKPAAKKTAANKTAANKTAATKRSAGPKTQTLKSAATQTGITTRKKAAKKSSKKSK